MKYVACWVSISAMEKTAEGRGDAMWKCAALFERIQMFTGAQVHWRTIKKTHMKPRTEISEKRESKDAFFKMHWRKQATFSQFSSVQLLSRVRLFATPWTAECQASLSITISRSSPKLMSIKSVMPSSHLILCHPLFLLPPIPPSIRVFSNQSTLRIRWQRYWSFSFSISPSNEHPGLASFRMDWLDLLAL